MSWNCQMNDNDFPRLALVACRQLLRADSGFCQSLLRFLYFFFRICVFGRSTWRLFPLQLHHQVVVSNLFLDFWFPTLILVEYMEKKEVNWAPASSAIFGSILVNTVERSPGLISLPVQSLWNHVCDFFAASKVSGLLRGKNHDLMALISTLKIKQK